MFNTIYIGLGTIPTLIIDMDDAQTSYAASPFAHLNWSTRDLDSF